MTLWHGRDVVIKWKQFSALLAICAGNSPVTGEFPIQRPVTRSFDVSFDLRPINGWVNNLKACDLRHQRAHYDVTVMHAFHITGFLLGESTGLRWIPITKVQQWESAMFFLIVRLNRLLEKQVHYRWFWDTMTSSMLWAKSCTDLETYLITCIHRFL